MAYDKAVDSARLDAAMKSTADAIRYHTGGINPIVWDKDHGFSADIYGLSASGSGPACAASVVEVNPTRYYRLTITDFRRQGEQVNYASMVKFALYDAAGKNAAVYDGGQLCSASSYSSTNEMPHHAFDGSLTSMWQSNYNTAPATTNWLQIGLNNPPDIVSFGITPRKDYGFDVPYVFYLSVSDDGESWTVLREFSGDDTGWTLGEERIFSLSD